MAERHDGPDSLRAPFVFVRHGDPPPLDWMAQHPGWVKFPGVMIPRDSPERPVNGGTQPDFPQRPPVVRPARTEESPPLDRPASQGAPGSMSRLTPGNPPRRTGGAGVLPNGDSSATTEVDPVTAFLRTNDALDRMLAPPDDPEKEAHATATSNPAEQPSAPTAPSS